MDPEEMLIMRAGDVVWSLPPKKKKIIIISQLIKGTKIHASLAPDYIFLIKTK
jgi:hypothetical protein